MLDRYESKIKQRADDVPNRVAASSMDDSQKREFIAGFNTTKDQGLRSLGEFFTIERSLVTKIEAIFNFMQSRQGRYKFAGDQIIFSSQRDVADYNGYLSDFNDVVEQENDWRMRAQSQSQEQLDKMQRMMKRR